MEGPSAKFCFVRWFSLCFLKVGSYWVCWLMAPGDWYSFFGCIFVMGAKERRKGLQVKTCVFTPCCYSFYSSNYSSLARGKSFGLNTNLISSRTSSFKVAFLLEITMMNSRCYCQSWCLGGRKSKSKTKRTARGRNHHMCVYFTVGGWGRAFFSWFLSIHSSVLHKLHLLFMYCSYSWLIFTITSISLCLIPLFQVF